MLFKQFQTNHEKHPGRLERTTQVFRFSGTVIAGTAWRLELSCRLFLLHLQKKIIFFLKVHLQYSLFAIYYLGN